MRKIFNKIFDCWNVSIKIGAGPYYKAKLIFAPYYFYLTRVFGFKSRAISVKARFYGRTFSLNIFEGGDIAILKEIFVDDQYLQSNIANPKIILDLGSNVGYSVIYFKLRYPKSIIYAFEPDPATFTKLVSNIEQFDNVIAINKALSDNCGILDFYVYLGSSMSSSTIKRTDKQTRISVQALSLDSFLSEYGIGIVDLLKFDVEGHEYRIFSKFDNIDKISNYVGELHLDLIKETENQFTDLFNGYAVTKLQTGDKRLLLYINKNK